MKVLHLNTYDSGGAAKACIRLHTGLRRLGMDSHVLFLHSRGEVPHSSQYNKSDSSSSSRRKNLLITKVLDRLPFVGNHSRKIAEIKKTIRENIPSRIEWFSFPNPGIDFMNHPLYKKADIINLHWVSDFFNYALLSQIDKPIVWTLHDQNPFTGGCHYSWHCTKYESDCDFCFQLEGIIDASYSKEIMKYKKKAVDSAGVLNIVAPSRWLTQASSMSRLFRGVPHHCIPYGLDSDVYQPTERNKARTLLELPLDKKILLFVSDALKTKRKGFSYLIEAIKMLPTRRDILLCSVGAFDDPLPDDFSVRSFGHISNEKEISLIYSAADVFVIPSLADNLPNTVLESLMCGTPIIGFPTGGIQDMIRHRDNGLICSEVSVAAMSETIHAFLGKSVFETPTQIRQDALKHYDISVQARSYIDLYKTLLRKTNTFGLMNFLKRITKRILKTSRYRLVRERYQSTRATVPATNKEDAMFAGLLRLAKAGLSPACVVDIGAAQGSWSLKAIHLWPQSKFVLFEPLEERQQELNRLSTQNNNVFIVPAAAGSKETEANFLVAADLDGSGMSDNNLSPNTRRVKVSTVDQEMKRLGTQGPFLLKLDTHGYEVPIFEGAVETLAQTELLVVECYGFRITPNSLLFWEMCEHLQNKGFRLIDVVDIMRRPKDDAFWQCDAFFVPDSSAVFSSNVYQ